MDTDLMLKAMYNSLVNDCGYDNENVYTNDNEKVSIKAIENYINREVNNDIIKN